MTTISTLVQFPPAPGRGILTRLVDGPDPWYFVVEIADPSAGAAVEWHDVTQFWRGHEYNRGADAYLGRYRASVATVDLWADDDSLAPWNDDTSPTFGVHVELGPGLLLRAGFVASSGGFVTGWYPRFTLKVEEWPDASYSRGKARQHRVTARDTLTSLVGVPIPASSDENWSNRVGGVITNAQWPYGALIYGAFTLAGSPVLTLPGQPEAASAISELDKACDPAGVVWYTDRTGALVVRPRVDDTWHAGLFAAGAAGTPYVAGQSLDFAWFACDLDDGSFAEYAVDYDPVGSFGVDRSELSVVNRVKITSPFSTFDNDDPVSVQRYDPKPYQATWVQANDVVAAQMLATLANATLVARPIHTTKELRGFVPGPAGADYLAPSLMIHRNRDDLKTVTVDGWLRRYTETIRPFGCDVEWRMTYTLDVASVVDVAASMRPVEGLRIVGVTDTVVEFAWEYPAQVVPPTHVQVRLRPTSSLWLTLPYPGDGATDAMEWAGLEPSSRYSFDVRVVAIDAASGLVTDFSPVRTLTFDTLETTVPDVDDDGTATLPDPGPCDLEWKLEQRSGSSWVFVAGGTITEPPYEVDLNPYLLDDETYYRSCVRDICDGVPGAWRCDSPWVLDCQPVSRLLSAPYSDSHLRAYWPQVCGVSGSVRIEEAISNEPMTPGNALVAVDFDDDDIPVLVSGPSGVIGYGVEPWALPAPSDATIACRARIGTLPTAAGRTLFEYDGLNLSIVLDVGGPDPDDSGFRVRGKVTTDDGVIHTINGTTIYPSGGVYDFALTHDVGGDVRLYVNAALEGTPLTTIGQRLNFGLYSIQLPASSWVTDCALWDRVLAPYELPGGSGLLTVTINQGATQSDPATSAPVVFDVAFSEPVSGFSAADVVITGTTPYTPSPLFTGGTITYDGAYTYHTFLANGTLTPIGAGGAVEYMIQAGGGGGEYGNGGGGGAGGNVRGTATITTPQAVVVGAGGLAGTGAAARTQQATNGADSSLGAIVATGGGKGATFGATTAPDKANDGGSGGGQGGLGIAGQGNNGGTVFGGTPGGASGGGGAGAAGANGTSGAGGHGGNGGAGVEWPTGSGQRYGGGGGGGGYLTGATYGAGGSGGGGRGCTRDNYPAVAGSVNSGGGGGGGGWHDSGGGAAAASGAAGGSGRVVVRYLTAAGASPTVTVTPVTSTTYTVEVSGMSGAGTVIADIPAGVCTSVASGALNEASTSTDNMVTYQPVSFGVWAHSSGSGTSPSATLTWPRAPVAGEVALLYLTRSNDAAFPTLPDFGSPVLSGSRGAVYTRLCTGTEATSYSIVIGGSAKHCSTILIFTGLPGLTVTGSAAGGLAVAPANVTYPLITPTNAPTWVLYSVHDSQTTFTSPSTPTNPGGPTAPTMLTDSGPIPPASAICRCVIWIGRAASTASTGALSVSNAGMGPNYYHGATFGVRA